MSHFSCIKTCIINKTVLKRTLIDLGFDYEDIQVQTQNKLYLKYVMSIKVKKNNINLFELIWNGVEFLFVADLQLWKYGTPYEQLLERITQRYSYNSIIEESIKQGFIRINEEKLKDGSIKLLLQRWH
uniref:Uncharacterized protein ycf35 n=1 Tax=Mastocarpus papillatus TaxID=31436 RepID=A0A342RZA7_9FLOR|nr:conserved hypothetical plastid protein [Mastocarpus papillatus]AOL58053.1 conserved hypothetical plastid protein [Mastocarpus papillatus]